MSDGIMLTAGMDFSNGEDCTMLTLIVDGKPDHVSCDTPWGRAVVDLLSERDKAADELTRLHAEVDRLTAALSDERAHADAMAEAVNAMDGFAVEIRDDRGRFYSVRAKDYERLDNLTRAHRARRQG